MPSADGPDAPDLVAQWCRVLHLSGKSQTAADFLEANDFLVEHPEVAYAATDLEQVLAPHLLVRALDVGVRHASGSQALTMRVRAALARGQQDEAERLAVNDPRALAALAERMSKPQSGLRVARRAYDLAPYDYPVLKALFRVSVKANDAVRARDAAQVLMADHEFEPGEHLKHGGYEAVLLQGDRREG